LASTDNLEYKIIKQ